jgi:hypothetical protein
MDESERDRRYYLCVAIVEPAYVTSARKQLNSFRLRGQRELHFAQENQSRRRALVDKIAQLPVAVRIYQTPYTPRTDEIGRQACLELAVSELLKIGAHRLVIDSRDEQDRHDTTTIQRILGDHPSRWNFSYEHNDSKLEPLCWVADAAAWCFGAGGDWRRRIMPIIDDVTEL